MYGFEIFSSNGTSQISSGSYGWVVLDNWVVKPIVNNRVTTKTWVIPPEFNDFKLFVSGSNCREYDGKETLEGLVRGYLTTLDTYLDLGNTVTKNSDGSTVISITLQEVSRSITGDNPNAYSTLVAHLVGR